MADLPATRPTELSTWTFDLTSPVRSGVALLRQLDELPGRIWRAMTMPAQSTPTEFKAGSDFINANSPLPGYDVREAMSSLGEFAWVVAGCNAIATDLSRLPLRASRGRGRGAKMLDDHPALKLIRRPASKTRMSLFRRQRMIDLLLAGYNGSLKVYGDPRRPPASLLRMHPFRMRVVAGTDGQIERYRYEGYSQTIVEYDWKAVLSAQFASWEDNPSGLYGQGLIRPLRRELSLDRSLQMNAEKSAKKGRPDGIISPHTGGDGVASMWTPEQTKGFRKDLGEIFSSAHGGYAVLGRPTDVQRLGWSPTDLGSLEQRGFTRQTVMAVLGVPPVRMGLETANYATAQQQAEVYWGDTLQGLAELEDEEFTDLAREFPDSEDVEIWHDFNDVPALQRAQRERLDKVTVHIVNGMAPKAAYKYEGFDDAPIDEAPAPVVAPPPPAKSAPLGIQRKSLFCRDHEPDLDAREAVWRAFIDRVHAKQESTLGPISWTFLQDQQKRVLARLEAQKSVTTRNTVADLLRKLWPDQTEDQALLDAYREAVREAVRSAAADSAQQLGVSLDFAPVRINAAVDSRLASMVVNINATTKNQIRTLLINQLNDGASTSEIQAAIQALGTGGQAFGPARARNIARTETTRSISSGQRVATLEAQESGVNVEEEWLTARDSHVRESHRKLDGIITSPNQPWEVDGYSVEYPGGFGDPAEDCNCRCTIVPRIKK